jgi:hypothetical protein
MVMRKDLECYWYLSFLLRWLCLLHILTCLLLRLVNIDGCAFFISIIVCLYHNEGNIGE